MAKFFKVLGLDGKVIATGRKVVRKVPTTMHDGYTYTAIVDADGFEVAQTVVDSKGRPAGWEAMDVTGEEVTCTVVPVTTVGIINLATADLDALLGG